jgi:hypothetical protein
MGSAQQQVPGPYLEAGAADGGSALNREPIRAQGHSVGDDHRGQGSHTAQRRATTRSEVVLRARASVSLRAASKSVYAHVCCVHVRRGRLYAAKGPHRGVGEAVRVHKGEHAPLLQQRVPDADLVVRSTSVLAAVACTIGVCANEVAWLSLWLNSVEHSTV